MSEITETVKVKHTFDGVDGYKVINKTDFDETAHTLYEGDAPAPVPAADVPRNASGTFDEPTPTDVRYHDKNLTEFENNHGAYVGKSAAEIRAAEGLPDAPGGLDPKPGFDPSKGPDEQPGVEPLRAAHRGGGSYSVMRGETPVETVEKMTKEDADAFNALSDVDKAAYVTDHTAA